MKTRTLLAAGVTALALAGCTPGTGATPAPPPTQPTPTATPSPSVTPTPASSGTTSTPRPTPRRTTTPPTTPRATPTGAHELPGALGQVPAGFKLPDEDRAGTDEVSAYTTTIWRATCPDTSTVALPAASRLAASRIKESLGPEHVDGNGLLVFPDAASATTFLAQLRTGLGACVSPGPAQDGFRQQQAVGPFPGIGDEALAIRMWGQGESDGTWRDTPDAGAQHIARKGRFVALTWQGGEYVGDQASNTELVDEAKRRLTEILRQV